MKKVFNLFLAISILFIVSSCGSDDSNAKFHLEKRYWDLSDYETAIFLIKGSQDGYPRYGSNKAAVFTKLIDTSNFSVVMSDNSLGLKHRNEFSQKMFDYYRSMHDVYSTIDNRDKYVYPMELVDVMIFGLDLQRHYFKLGNDKIIKEADNPDSEEIKALIRSNDQILVGNYVIYLDCINRETALSSEAISKYAIGIDKYFSNLIKLYPAANYSEMQSKAILMQKKAESKEIKDSLTKLISLLEEKNKKEEILPN